MPEIIELIVMKLIFIPTFLAFSIAIAENVSLLTLHFPWTHLFHRIYIYIPNGGKYLSVKPMRRKESQTININLKLKWTRSRRPSALCSHRGDCLFFFHCLCMRFFSSISLLFGFVWFGFRYLDLAHFGLCLTLTVKFTHCNYQVIFHLMQITHFLINYMNGGPQGNAL